MNRAAKPGFDRRGRGDSEDTLPYAVDREIEDLAALLETAGGSAHVLGASSGAALALLAAQEKIAHTLAYDDRILGDYALLVDAAAEIAVPTLILTGGESMPFFRPTAVALAAAIPDARAEILEGQAHVADPKVLAPVVEAFLQEGPHTRAPTDEERGTHGRDRTTP